MQKAPLQDIADEYQRTDPEVALFCAWIMLRRQIKASKNPAYIDMRGMIDKNYFLIGRVDDVLSLILMYSRGCCTEL